MSTQARRHHYIPRFYLGAFTDTGTADGQVWAFDLQAAKRWHTGIENVACITDYYRVDLPDTPKDALEQVFGTLEGDFAPVVAQVIKSGTLPEGRERNLLLNFVALMAVRTPALRRLSSVITDALIKGVGPEFVRSEGAWRSAVGDHAPAAQGPSYHEMKEFVESEEYTAQLDQTSQMQMLLDLGDDVLRVLHALDWKLASIPSATGLLVCSDSPVSILSGKRDPRHTVTPENLSFCSVTMPIAPRAALAGALGTRALDGHEGPEVAAWLNTRTMCSAERFVFAPASSFFWLDNRRRLRSSDEVLSGAFRGRSSPLGPSQEELDRMLQCYARPGIASLRARARRNLAGLGRRSRGKQREPRRLRKRRNR